jgi:peptide deformylase
MAAYDIRQFGDPVLRQVASEVTNIDGKLVALTLDMIETMYAAPGLGLAAPQIGVQKRLFVYDLNDGDGAKVLVNPVISESRGEWSYDEGCLSVVGLSWEIVRPKEIHLTGFDLDGNEISIEADELMARLYQHELDHLDGKLLIDYLDTDQRAEAMKILRGRILSDPKPAAKAATAKNKFGLSLPGKH